MLQIFADALLIATRLEPRYHADRRRPDPEEEARAGRRWMSLTGLRR